jgi:hypothetical protein
MFSGKLKTTRAAAGTGSACGLGASPAPGPQLGMGTAVLGAASACSRASARRLPLGPSRMAPPCSTQGISVSQQP